MTLSGAADWLPVLEATSADARSSTHAIGYVRRATPRDWVGVVLWHAANRERQVIGRDGVPILFSSRADAESAVRLLHGGRR